MMCAQWLLSMYRSLWDQSEMVVAVAQRLLWESFWQFSGACTNTRYSAALLTVPYHQCTPGTAVFTAFLRPTCYGILRVVERQKELVRVMLLFFRTSYKRNVRPCEYGHCQVVSVAWRGKVLSLQFFLSTYKDHSPASSFRGTARRLPKYIIRKSQHESI